MKIKFCACGWRINIWNIILDSSASAIWYFYFVSAIVLVFRLLFSFCNLVSAIWYFCFVSAIVLVFHLLFSFCNLIFELSFYKKIWSDILSSASAKSGISTVLQLLQFGISVCLCNCFGISSSLQLLQFGISFCNLVFLFCLCNCFDISSSLQFLQFGIWVKFLQKNLEWYFVFRFCKIWYFDFPSASVMASTTKEIVWLRWLLADMRVFFSFLILLLWIVTTRVLFRLLTTRFLWAH